ncbi:MAG: S46 family peptidase [Bacteroidota bacterium]|nr:S46 family peptidase [Bacteroidota bacterium]
MKRRFLIPFFLLFLAPSSILRADEGMWLPILLDQLNIANMQATGFKLTAEDIYSVNKSSMKDAVVQFGGGCTAELISGKGLILTNHHCGYGSIQSHSSVEHNYLDKGFWAMNQSEELPCPGLTSTFIVSMEDVTAKVLAGVTDAMNETERAKTIELNSKILEKENTKNGLDAMVRAFYYGNVYYMFMTQTFKDIRMVGAPPQQIGNFGGDSDNWMWPRQTGDFSLFRIYADKNNNPAEYSADNVPYTPKHFFKINANGVGENDFTMVYGFPGKTTEYLSSWGVSLIANVSDPVKVGLRTQRIGIMEEEMHKTEVVKIQYAAKRNGTANAWKKWQGEAKGLKDNNVVAKKQAREAEFQKRVDADPAKKVKYGTLLPQMQTAYSTLEPWQKSVDLLSEGCFSVEIVGFARPYLRLVELSQKPNPDAAEIARQVASLKAAIPGYFKNYNVTVDKRIAVALFSTVDQQMSQPYYTIEIFDKNHNALKKSYSDKPPVFAMVKTKYKGDFGKYFDMVFAKTIFTDSARLMALLRNYTASDYKKLVKDPAFVLTKEISDYFYSSTLPQYTKANDEVSRLNRLYMAAQMEVFKDQKFYPDANSTLRVAYGKIDDYSPRDGLNYNWFCTLDGVMQKEDATTFDYVVPAKLHELWVNKDYGTYADKKDGKIHTTFIASNHTTGGNSGSPVLDANGNLIGTNFDRVWEGTMSDVNYDPSICRNIALDVRYTLFIIDKFAGAGYLLNEMVFVK